MDPVRCTQKNGAKIYKYFFLHWKATPSARRENQLVQQAKLLRAGQRQGCHETYTYTIFQL